MTAVTSSALIISENVKAMALFPMTNAVSFDKRERSDNWTSKEKLFLLDLCSMHTDAIENRKHDAYSAKKKSNAWNLIHVSFSTKFGTHRTPQRLKEQWRRLKSMARLEMKNSDRSPSGIPDNLEDQLVYMRGKISSSQEEEEKDTEGLNKMRAILAMADFNGSVNYGGSSNGGETINEYLGNGNKDYTTDDEEKNPVVMEFKPQLPNNTAPIDMEDSTRPSTSSESTPQNQDYYSMHRNKTERSVLDFQRREHEQRMAFLDAEHCARMELLEIEKRKVMLERDKAEIERDIASMKRMKLMQELGIE